jgi:hypothetical protein
MIKFVDIDIKNANFDIYKSSFLVGSLAFFCALFDGILRSLLSLKTLICASMRRAKGGARDGALFHLPG